MKYFSIFTCIMVLSYLRYVELRRVSTDIGLGPNIEITIVAQIW